MAVLLCSSLCQAWGSLSQGAFGLHCTCQGQLPYLVLLGGPPSVRIGQTFRCTCICGLWSLPSKGPIQFTQWACSWLCSGLSLLDRSCEDSKATAGVHCTKHHVKLLGCCLAPVFEAIIISPRAMPGGAFFTAGLSEAVIQVLTSLHGFLQQVCTSRQAGLELQNLLSTSALLCGLLRSSYAGCRGRSQPLLRLTAENLQLLASKQACLDLPSRATLLYICGPSSWTHSGCCLAGWRGCPC